MSRATMQQRAERMKTARELRQQYPPAEATRLLAERYALSPVQARRYVRATTEETSLAQAAVSGASLRTSCTRTGCAGATR